MHIDQSPIALTEHALEGAGHFLFQTHAGAVLVNLGLLFGIGYLGYRGLKAIGSRMFDSRSRVQSLLA